MSTKLRAGVFLDLDGTLTDNIDLMYSCFDEFMKSQGRSASLEEFSEFNGVPLKLVIDELRRRYSWSPSVQDLWLLYEDILKQSYRSHPPRQGAVTFLEKARELGFTLALVTSAPRGLADDWVNTQNLRSLFEFTVCAESVMEGKPSPEPYLLALERSQVTAAGSFAIEDSRNGIASASSAGLSVIQMKQEAETPQLPGAWKAVSHFSEVLELIYEV